MKKIIALITLLMFPFSVYAESFVSQARVIESTPIIETVYEEYDECRYETRITKRQRNRSHSNQRGLSEEGVFGGIIGGVTGGVIGNQFGKGKGKTATTAAGAVIGALVGSNLGQKSATPVESYAEASQTKRVRVCYPKQKAKKIITGYSVIYEYNNVRHTGVLPSRPGNYVDIHVDINLTEEIPEG